MMRRALCVALAALAVGLLAVAGQPIKVTGQLLAYQDGFVFFTTGDGFRVAPTIVIHDAKTGGATSLAPGPRIWARATFDATGTVTELDLSRRPLPVEGNFAQVTQFAVALSSPVPNPDLVPYVPKPGSRSVPSRESFSGKPVVVVFTVQVPPNTPFTSTIYMTTDQSGWNPQAIPMDRIDALHYRVVQRLRSGTIFHYLYDRGSLQQEEVAQNGLQRKPRVLVVTNADVRAANDEVYAWLDTSGGSIVQQPGAVPTPFNPVPFPNLPPGFPPPSMPPSHPGKPPG